MNEPNWEELSDFYYDKPVEFVEDIIEADPSPQQREVLESVRDNPSTAVKAGHGVGKSAVEAWVVLWYMFTRFMCRIPCTAPTAHQLNDILWPEIKKWYNKSKLKEYDIFLWTKTRFAINDQEYKDVWFATPRSSNEPDNMQGFHADEVLYIVDEASGVKQSVMEVVEGALTNDGARLLMCGNPTQVSGMFYNAFKKYKDSYNCITLSCEDSPLVSQEYVDRIYDKYGYHSNVARVRVRGEFPTAEDDTVLPIDILEKATMKEIDPVGDVIHIGVDVARYGDDESTWYIRKGHKIIEYKIHMKNDIMFVSNQSANMAKQFNRDYKVKIKIDVTGVGAGAVDRLREMNLSNVEIFEVANNQKAKDEEKYADAITEMYFEFKTIAKDDDIEIPNDEELIGQLSTRKYEFDSNGRFKIESKKKYKKRQGFSPDRADGFLLCWYEPPKQEEIWIV